MKVASVAREDESGFSLIELIVVVAIMGILILVAIPTYGYVDRHSRRVAAESAAAQAATTIEAAITQGYTVTHTGDPEYAFYGTMGTEKKLLVGNNGYHYWSVGDENSPDNVCVVAAAADPHGDIRASDGMASNCRGNTWDSDTSNGADDGYDGTYHADE